jgi:hypothetical protein
MALAPSLSSLSSTSYTSDNNNLSMRALGSNFLSGDTLNLHRCYRASLSEQVRQAEPSFQTVGTPNSSTTRAIAATGTEK